MLLKPYAQVLLRGRGRILRGKALRKLGAESYTTGLGSQIIVNRTGEKTKTKAENHFPDRRVDLAMKIQGQPDY